MNNQGQMDTACLRARAHDVQVRRARLVERCQDERGKEGITRLRLKAYNATHALIVAENDLARGQRHD